MCVLHTHPFAKDAAAAAMSSPSSGEQYEEEEDGAYESQAKRLKPSAAAEEGEIEYGAEEGETRREKAAPRAGGFSGGVRKAGAAHPLGFFFFFVPVAHRLGRGIEADVQDGFTPVPPRGSLRPK